MRHRQFHKKPERLPIFQQAAGVIICLVTIVAAGVYSLGSMPFIAATAKGCNIKGNVSINSREKIFHVPGQEYYLSTNISPQYGERWFCSEEEARAAGWRKARN